MELNMTLGELIAKRRKYLRMTQSALAEEIHVSKSAVAKWETNGGVPDRDNLKALSQVLKISLEDLYRIIERKEDDGYGFEGYILHDIIAVLESYAYRVIRPANEQSETGR